MMQDLHRVFSAYWRQFLFVLPKLALALVLLLVAFFIANRVSALLGRRLRSRAHDPLLADFLTRISKWSLMLLGLLLAMHVVGLSGIVSGLLAGAGLSAFIVGFAFKDIAENFLAGVILAFNRPFHIHDTVQIRDQIGYVEALNLRTTLIRTLDGKHVFLPNSLVLKEPLVNFTRDGNLRQDFLVSVDYGEAGSPDELRRQVLDFVRAQPDVQDSEGRLPYIILEKAAGTTADLRVYFWTSADEYRSGTLQIKGNLMQALKAKLQEAGYAAPSLAQ
jgi:small conductance mechanosensitive channel